MKSFLKFLLHNWALVFFILMFSGALYLLFFVFLEGVILYDQQIPNSYLLAGFIGGVIWSFLIQAFGRNLFIALNDLKDEYLDWIHEEYLEEIKPAKPSISRADLDKR